MAFDGHAVDNRVKTIGSLKFFNMDYFIRTRQIFLLVVLFSLLLGYAAGMMVGNYGDVSTPASEEAATEGVDTNLLTLDPVKEFTAEVVSITDDAVIIKILSFNDPYLSPNFLERTLKVTPETRITTTAPRDNEMVTKELKAYDAAKAAAKNEEEAQAIPFPVVFEKKTVGKEEIKPGLQLSILTDDDMRLKKEFSAESIEILPPVQ